MDNRVAHVQSPLLATVSQKISKGIKQLKLEHMPMGLEQGFRIAKSVLDRVENR